MFNYSFKTPLSILIILAILVYSFFIYQTIFFIDGHLYFTLVDDAMISMNYAKHLADGHGMVWNIGDDPIQGFSNLGWMLYMSLIHLLPVDPSKISLLIMITSIFILISLAITIYFITYGLYRTSKQTAFLATIITIFYFPLVYWSLRGMEVGLVTLFIYLSIYFAFKLESIPNYLNALKLGVLMFCAVITRFDSSAQISLIVLYLFITGLKNGQLKLHSIPIIFFIFSILGLFTFQYFYFGDMLPNTYQLKVLGVSIFERIDVGLDVFFDYAFRDFSALFFIVIGGLLYYKELRTYKITLLLGLLLIQVFYSIYVGGDYAEPALRAIARHGKYLVIGFTAGIPKMPLNLTLLKECQIVGVFWGQFAAIDQKENQQNFKELFELHSEGKINPFVTETYRLEEAADAIKTLEDRKVLGKVVVTME